MCASDTVFWPPGEDWKICIKFGPRGGGAQKSNPGFDFEAGGLEKSRSRKVRREGLKETFGGEV